jgi:hypothetical protein
MAEAEVAAAGRRHRVDAAVGQKRGMRAAAHQSPPGPKWPKMFNEPVKK